MEWNVYQHYKCKQMWKCMKNKKKKENCLMCGLFAVANYKLNIRWIKLNVNEKAKKKEFNKKRMVWIGSWPMFIRRIRTSWINIMRNFFQLQIETFLMFLAIKPTLFTFIDLLEMKMEMKYQIPTNFFRFNYLALNFAPLLNATSLRTLFLPSFPFRR